jgi:hypothetical protein
MSTTYPDTSAGVNEQEEPKPNFYAIIPASVRYCKELQPAAKLLFGELVALTSIKGYCYARDPYFMHLYEVDRTTIQRWLASLKQKGFIHVDFNRATNERRIYVLAMQQGLTQKRDKPDAKMQQASRKNAAHSITENNTKNNTTTLNVSDTRFVEPGPVPAKELEEQKGQAPPASGSEFAWKQKRVNEVVAVTGDAKSILRFRQLLDLADASSCVAVWEEALVALADAQKRSTEPVERPGAYFCSVLVSGLNARGVAVPVGMAKERRSVKSQIAASLAAAGEGQEVPA